MGNTPTIMWHAMQFPLPCLSGEHRVGERTDGRVVVRRRVSERARMPPVFNDLIKNVSPTRRPTSASQKREREGERSRGICRRPTTSGYLPQASEQARLGRR